MDYTIWTFTDASMGFNRYSNTKVGVYGFVHMGIDISSGNLYPWAAGFQAISGFDINTLEASAVYLALIDIRRVSSDNRICIVTDSDGAYYKLQGAIATNYGHPIPKWMGTRSICNTLIMACSDLYINLTMAGFNIDLKLCKSHASFDTQKNYLKKQRDISDNRYVRNIHMGNTYADYYVSNIAINGFLPSVQQYSNGSCYLQSIGSGYVSQLL